MFKGSIRKFFWSFRRFLLFLLLSIIRLLDSLASDTPAAGVVRCRKDSELQMNNSLFILDGAGRSVDWQVCR